MTLSPAIPVLHMSKAAQAEEFYCRGLGFELVFAQRTPETDDPAYLEVRRGDCVLHLSSHAGDGAVRAAVLIRIDDVDALFRECSARGVRFDPEPVDQTWGQREAYAKDPDGNSIRFFTVLG
ncbi:MAG TPA: VOC family protein [Fimbriimonadaceae bacterium]|nr:VOC family protein [Fimbriimonadaceae bacterium]HRJ95852.1 VOC family protein [Fimbriimonadaceae bacterium]